MTLPLGSSSSIRFLLRTTVFGSRLERGAVTARIADVINDTKHDEAIKESKEFRQLSLNPARKERKRMEERKHQSQDMMPPRAQRMHVDQDWANVWPTAATFKPASIPLPLRMGFDLKRSPIDKFGNAELMKIPNFFHLTPVAIKKHCRALKQLCTPWPAELRTDEDCSKQFPVETISGDYCHAGPSISNSRARIVTLRVKMSQLKLDFHARDKFLRLIKDRYDPRTDFVTIIADRCPTKKQNYDYVKYLLTALFFESWKTELWEAEKTVADHDQYYWDGSPSEETVRELIGRMQQTKLNASSESEVDTSNTADQSGESERKRQGVIEEKLKRSTPVQGYKTSVERIMNEGENLYALEEYKKNVKKLLGFS